jgi:sulfate adenylyltransferase subunit 1
LGITIDVAYKYFSTSNRRFIIIDAPGHVQYTKNLVSGASQANLMIILIDISNGITPQTLVHLYVAWFMEIPEVIIAVNKLDLFDFQSIKFNEIKNLLENTFSLIKNYRFVPISAFRGDNVISKSSSTHWYTGPTIYDYLLNSKLNHEISKRLIIQVQYISINNNLKYCYCRIESGKLSENTALLVANNLIAFNYLDIFKGFEKLKEASAFENICFIVEENFDINQGDVIVSKDVSIKFDNKLKAAVVCLSNLGPLITNKVYDISIGLYKSKCQILKIFILNINVTPINAKKLEINQFAFVSIEFIGKIPLSAESGKPLITKAVLLDSESGLTLAALNFNLTM